MPHGLSTVLAGLLVVAACGFSGSEPLVADARLTSASDGSVAVDAPASATVDAPVSVPTDAAAPGHGCDGREDCAPNQDCCASIGGGGIPGVKDDDGDRDPMLLGRN